MSPLLQNVMAVAIVLVAATYVGHRIWLGVRGQGKGCGAGCGTCPASSPGEKVVVELKDFGK